MRRRHSRYNPPIPSVNEVCVIKYTERGDEKSVAQIIPAAGSWTDRPLEAKTSLLRTAGSDDVEGVILEFKGQVYNDLRQRTIIELTCDQSEEVPAPALLWNWC